MVLFVDPSLRWLTNSSGLMEVNVTAKKMYDLLVNYQSIVKIMMSRCADNNIRHSLSAEVHTRRKNGAKQFGTNRTIVLICIDVYSYNR